MIVYTQLETVATDLGLPLSMLFSVSNALSDHYKTVEIPKRSGGVRRLRVPDACLKKIQRRINDVLLSQMRVSEYATAYHYGCKLVKNAKPHVGGGTLLKLDIKDFFDSVLYCQVKKYAFPESRYSEKLRILLSVLCYFKESLPQGAPTSPAISNIIMFDFDETVGKWCKENGIAYTRYCDDMTFSGELDPAKVIGKVKKELKKYGFILNRSKIRVIGKGSRQCVTGITVNEKLSVPIAYREQIRKEIYYLNKYGLDSHLEKIGYVGNADSYLRSLAGRINHVLTVTPDNAEMCRYAVTVNGQIRKKDN